MDGAPLNVSAFRERAHVDEVERLAATAVPFMSAAADSYGESVLARTPPELADEASNLGKRLLIQVFGRQEDGEPLPREVSALVVAPRSEDARSDVLLATRQLLAANPIALRGVRLLLASPPGVTQFTQGERDAIAGGRDVQITNNYYHKDGRRRSAEIAWPSTRAVLLGAVSIVGLQAAFLALHWSPYWAVSVAVPLVAGTSLWFSRPRDRSWRDGPMVTTIGLYVVIWVVLVSASFVQATYFPFPWVDPQGSAHAAEGPVLIESVTPFSSADGNTWATAKDVRLSSRQLAQFNAENNSNGMDSPASLGFLASIHAVPVGYASTDVTIMGNYDKTVTIVGLQVVKDCQAPLSGTLFDNPPEAATSTIGLGFDLDSQVDYAQNPNQSGEFSGNYFKGHVVTLAQGETQTLQISVAASSHYCTFVISMMVATPGGTVTETINDGGKPFELTGYSPSAKYSTVYVGGDATESTSAHGAFVEVNPSANPYG